MITPSKEGISKDGSQYYGSAEYYSEKDDIGVAVNKHAPMQWVGGGAELLGLPSEIKTEADLKDFDNMIKGKLPDGREMPQIAQNGKERRTGEDFVASAPKSVSIMATYGRDERILEAHNKAVLATVAKIQERMMAVRGMVDGQQQRVDGEFVIALAQHLDSRPVDGFVGADMHTHMLFMNVAIRSADGELRAVDWVREKGWEKEINATYLSELASELRKLGYDLYTTKDAFEIVGIDRQMIEDYSPRLKAIERELEKMGLTRATATAEQKQAAAFKTREDKGTVTHDQMIAQGDKLAKEKGYDFQSIKEAALLNERHETHEQRMDFAAEALKSATRHFSERQSVFEAKEVIKYALKSGLPNGVTERELRQAWTERKDKHGLLTAKSPIDPKTGEVSKERFMTTRLAVARDEKMIRNLQAGKGVVSDRLTSSQADREIAILEAKKGFQLGADQARAVHMTLESADRITCWQGYAGAGKTTAVEGVKQALEAQGYKVIGLAPTTKAVHELADVNIESESIAMWFAKGGDLDDKTFVIIDESGMVSSKDLARVVDRVEAAEARALFIGDWRQLQSVAAGAPFKKMQDYCRTVELTEIQRQKANPEMLEIAELFSSGRAAEAALKMGKFMTQINTEGLEDVKQVNQAIAEAAAQKYLALSTEKPQPVINEHGKEAMSITRDNTLIIVATNAVREMVNEKVREGLKNEGVLGAEDAITRTLHAEAPTEEQLRQAFWYEDKMKDEDGQAVQIVIIPQKDYAVHGAKFADEATQRHHIEMRALAKVNDIEKEAPVILEKGQEYRVLSVDLQKAEVRLIDKENREIIWKPSEAGKVTAYQECHSKFAVGDKVIFKENQTKLPQPDGTEAKVFNGQKGVVTAISDDKVFIKTAKGEDVAINKDGGVRVEHVYSGTVHSVQGATDGHGKIAIRAASKINDANQAYVGETRFKYSVEVITDNIAQLQKDWSQYKYQQNAIDYANPKDLRQFNQQQEEKKMEVIEKEDGLDPTKNQAQPEPEQSAAVTNEREAPEAAAPQPEAAHAAPGKDAEREAATPAPREPDWFEDVPAVTSEHEYLESEPEPSSPHDMKQERMEDAMGEGGGGNSNGKPAFECMAPPAKGLDIDWAAEAETERQMRERIEIVEGRCRASEAGLSLCGVEERIRRSNDIETARASLIRERDELYKEIHARMEKDRETNPNAHPDPFLAPPREAGKEPEKAVVGEKEAAPEREEKAQGQPEATPREPERLSTEQMKPWAEYLAEQEKERNAYNAKVMAEMIRVRPEHVHEAGRDASGIEARLGAKGAQQFRSGINNPPKQPPTQHKDKGGMEREM